MAMTTLDPTLLIPANFRQEDELQQLANSEDVKKLLSLLEEGEIIYRIVLCFHNESEAVLAATNRRLLFVDQKFISSTVVSYHYSEIAAVVFATHLITRDMTLVHATGSLTVSKVDKEHGGRFLQFVDKLIGSDYETAGQSKRIFKHSGDMLELTDLESHSDDA